MTIGSVPPTPRRAKGSFTAGEVTRALVASAAIGGILLLAVFVTTGSYFSAEHQGKNGGAKNVPLSPPPGGGAGHRLGATVGESDKKGRCEERRFDNRNGRIVSSNYVDCEARLADERNTTPPKNMEGERKGRTLGGC